MAKKSNLAVFFDFDNTIARFDVFDDLIKRFSRDANWIELEEKWKKGKIGSRQCLEGQLKGLGISKEALNKYLERIKLDPYFKRFIKFLRSRKIKTVVLSDNFDYILKRALRHNGLKNLKVYSNRMQFARDRIIPHFPYSHKNCRVCAHCKKKNLLANVNQDNIIIYIGDGRSDICPAQHADIIFAKDSLLEYCRQKKLAHIPFKNLKEVFSYFQEV